MEKSISKPPEVFGANEVYKFVSLINVSKFMFIGNLFFSNLR